MENPGYAPGIDIENWLIGYLKTALFILYKYVHLFVPYVHVHYTKKNMQLCNTLSQLCDADQRLM